MIFLVIYSISIIGGVIAYYINPSQGIVKSLLDYQMLIGVGFGSVLSAMGHTFGRKEVAKKIGWESNMFQVEMGFVTLGIGFAGIMSFWYDHPYFRLPIIIIISVFQIAAGIIHIVEIKKKGNFAPYNTFIILPDFVGPATLIVLFLLLRF